MSGRGRYAISGRAPTGTVTRVIAAYGEHTVSPAGPVVTAASFDLLGRVDRRRP